MKTRIDLETTDSNHKGVKGLIERLLRRFKIMMHLMIMIPVYGLGLVTLGLCLVPGISMVRAAGEITQSQPAWLQNIGYGLAIGCGFMSYGVCLIFAAPFLNFVLRTKLKAWRGPYYSAEAIRWFLHNFFTYMVRYTFLEVVTPSPLSILFYKMMGMKIGKGAAINTTCISDPSLIQLGDKVTLGGSVTIVAHYGQGGFLVIAPVKIGSGCTIGLRASIMGGVEIGDGAVVLPHSVVMPKTIIPAGEKWGGVPARKLEASELGVAIKTVA